MHAEEHQIPASRITNGYYVGDSWQLGLASVACTYTFPVVLQLFLLYCIAAVNITIYTYIDIL